MAKSYKPKAHQQVALFFLEGYSEEAFYERILKSHLVGVPKSIKNVKGLYNIHKIVMGKTIEFARKHSDYYLRIYCCIDRESRDRSPELDIDQLRHDIAKEVELRDKVLSADTILPTQMLESWFFHDIEGIFRYLKAPSNKRNATKFLPIEKNTWKTLHALFTRHGKTYLKGERSGNFLDNLDLDLIYQKCSELREGIQLVKKNSMNFKKTI